MTEEYENTLVKKPSGEKHLSTMVTVQKMYKEGGILTHEEQSETELEICIPLEGVPMARVSAEARMTLNMGNFESVQLGISVELPCFIEEVEDCYKAAKSIVDMHLNKETTDIYCMGFPKLGQ